MRFLTTTPMLYVFAIGIWGSTWYVIKLQLGVVAPELSIAYRFALASVLLFLWAKAHGKTLYFSRQQHKYFFWKGITLYSVGYFAAYHAGGMIPSGLNSVLFSTMIFFNLVATALFFKTPIAPMAWVGALMGLAGLCLVFWPELQCLRSLDATHHTTLLGMGLSLFAAVIASLGNLLSYKSQHKGASVMQANAYAMGYGALISFIYALCLGREITFDWSWTYGWSLLYLAIPGSIITFGCYLTAVGRLGPDKAGYPMVLIPVVSLVISEALENYQWSPLAPYGIVLLILGNVLVTFRKKSA